MVKILSDSCSDLDKDLLKAYDVGVIDLNVFMNRESYLDQELSQAELFNLVSKHGKLSKTLAKSV